VNNDPVNWVDLWGLFTFQIGISGTAGAGTGGTGEAGIIIAWDPSNPFSIEIGVYTTTGLGAQHHGASASVSVELTVSTNTKASDMAGSSVASGGSYSVGKAGPFDVGVGAQTVVSLDGKNTATNVGIGINAGTKSETHTYYTNTQVSTTTVSFNKSEKNTKGK
jgi:hypothetical protein